MKRLRLAFTYVFVGIIGYGLAFLHQWVESGRGTTVTRLSPDETIRARLVETSPSWGLDRNVMVQLEFLVNGNKTTIFRSPDEGRPEGTERLIWSKDGTKLLLVGRHFYVKEDLFLDNGDQLYFLYDLPSGQRWCNADQSSGDPPMTAETIRGVEFTEPVTLKAR